MDINVYLQVLYTLIYIFYIYKYIFHFHRSFFFLYPRSDEKALKWLIAKVH